MGMNVTVSHPSKLHDRTGRRASGSTLRALRSSRWICCAVVLALACGGEKGAGPRRFLSLGTAGTGGVYYPIGGTLASRLSLRDTSHTYTAEVTGGSVENIQRIMRGEMDLGFAIGTTVYEAYNGGGDFKEPVTRLRVVAPLYPNQTHVLVRDGASISAIADLRGKRVSVGPGGGGTEEVAKHVLEAYGLSFNDVQTRYLSFTESASALADGAIDAAILSIGYPASAVLEATTTGRVHLLPIDSAHATQLSHHYAYYSVSSLPAGSYPGLTKPLPTVSVLNWIVARDDLDRNVVNHVLDILAEEMPALRQAVDIAGQIKLTNLYAAPIPLHDATTDWLHKHVGANENPGGATDGTTSQATKHS